ncbi:MAG: hypothetical protein ACJ8EC_24125 [Microvirga sp.]
MFLIGIALLGLSAFGLGWALLGNMAGTLLVTFPGSAPSSTGS